MIVALFFLVSSVKLLLIPSYRSTDFEVHRNWLAITNSLPLNKWYFDNTSEWTLDYPPLFAYFEYILSLFAKLFDDKMLIIENFYYSSKTTILFQRLSVIFTDLVYTYGAYKVSSSFQKSWKTDIVLPCLLVINCGLLMVDHIHFQYNGILFGILLISISFMLQEKYIMSSIFFTILINMKHIFMYMAPAYFVYLLKHFCLSNQKPFQKPWLMFNYKNFFTLTLTVLSIFIFTFLPFYDHIPQVLSRMFPFKRGLCHAYWAPNLWVLYNIIDKILFYLLTKFNFNKDYKVASMTGGLVQEFSHSVLPNIKPITTLIITIIFLLPALIKLWNLKKDSVNFLRCLVICTLTSFIFGWHVHEKAILMAIIPLSVLSIVDCTDANIFLILSVTGHYSLFPLLYPNSLIFVKVLLILIYSLYCFHSLSKIYPLTICKYSFPLLNTYESLYLLGFCCLFFYDNVIHYLFGLNKKLPFLPLLLTSFYCSIGVMYCWIKYYIYFLRKNINYRNIVKEHSK